jgi:alpha-beta hydrolase superfamily lysophospholipase
MAVRSEFVIDRPDGVAVHAYRWAPEGGATPKAVIQMAHGNGEHAGRYDETARRLTAAGFIVAINDHRGHGKTANGRSGDIRPNDQGCEGVLGDMRALTDLIRESTRLPVFLLGYSWGSSLAVRYAQRWGGDLKGLALTGVLNTPWWLVPLLGLAIGDLKRRLHRRGYDVPDSAAFRFIEGYNRRVVNPRTPYDWLSRDTAAIDQYMADPLCRRLHATLGFAAAGLELTRDMFKKENMAAIPAALPVYLFSGAEEIGRAHV